ncbi:uncharacterized protein LOC126843363 isoform X2 [Adelges cooleyi]|nr:uncharacterized protein LOC126843363 isoform X2 [Adelges cooleyi]
MPPGRQNLDEVQPQNAKVCDTCKHITTQVCNSCGKTSTPICVPCEKTIKLVCKTCGETITPFCDSCGFAITQYCATCTQASTSDPQRAPKPQKIGEFVRENLDIARKKNAKDRYSSTTSKEIGILIEEELNNPQQNDAQGCANCGMYVIPVCGKCGTALKKASINRLKQAANFVLCCKNVT